MTRQHNVGVGGDTGQVPGLEGDPHLARGDRDRPGPDPGNTRQVSDADCQDDLSSDHDRAGHSPSRTAAPSLKKDGIQSASKRGI